MKGYLVVESQEEYNNWLKQMAEMNAESSNHARPSVAATN
jgi:cytochrome c oxidase subunit 2